MSPFKLLTRLDEEPLSEKLLEESDQAFAGKANATALVQKVAIDVAMIPKTGNERLPFASIPNVFQLVDQIKIKVEERGLEQFDQPSERNCPAVQASLEDLALKILRSTTVDFTKPVLQTYFARRI